MQRYRQLVFNEYRSSVAPSNTVDRAYFLRYFCNDLLGVQSAFVTDESTTYGLLAASDSSTGNLNHTILPRPVLLHVSTLGSSAVILVHTPARHFLGSFQHLTRAYITLVYPDPPALTPASSAVLFGNSPCRQGFLMSYVHRNFSMTLF